MTFSENLRKKSTYKKQTMLLSGRKAQEEGDIYLPMADPC